MRLRSLVVLCGALALLVPARSTAAPKVAPAATLGPLCEAFVTGVFKKVAPGELPVKLLSDPAPKVGPYQATTSSGKLGGVKVTTVLTGLLEYQDGQARSVAPLFCVGTDKAVGYFYASRPSTKTEDRPIVPVQQCYARFKADAAGATACIKGLVAESEASLASAVEAGKAKATQAGGDALKNFEASQQEFVRYRAHSCDMFKTPDASTDGPDFLNACLARLNTMRVEKLGGKTE